MKKFLTFSLFCVSLHGFTQDTVSIYFDFNSSDISTEQLAKLNSFLSSEHGEIISLSAYCDTIGTNIYNQKLAQRRLNAVLNKTSLKPKTELVNGETDANRMKIYNDIQARRVDIVSPKTSVIDETDGRLVLKKQFKEFLAGNDQTKAVDLKLLFIAGQPILITSSIPEMIELFEIMRDNPNIDAHIHGHVCCADDYKLSFERATMVHDYLTSKGILKDRLKYTGHSNKTPKTWPEVTETDKLSNRRVAVVFTKK